MASSRSGQNKELGRYLKCLKGERDKLEAALKDEAAQLRAATPEQQKIKAIRKRRDDAKAEIEELRTKLLLPLRRLSVHSEVAERVRIQIEGLLSYRMDTAATIIGLLEELIERPAADKVLKSGGEGIREPKDWRDKTVLRPDEVASILRVDVRTIYNYLTDGELREAQMIDKKGAPRRILRESVEKMLLPRK